MRLAILLQVLPETNWEAEDSVGITCGTEQVNIHYKYKGNGLFAAKGGNAEEIWVLGSGEYDVVAYAPFSGTSGEEQPVLEVTTASDNQATAEERAKIDFLFAKGKATSQTPNVTLAFNHVMSRIRLEFQAGEGVDLADITCYLIGLKNNVHLILKQGRQQSVKTLLRIKMIFIGIK